MDGETIDAINAREADEEQRKAVERARELQKIIDFGMGVEAFLESEIGRRIVQDDEAERLSLMEESVRLDVTQAAHYDRMREIYGRVAVLDHVQQRFADYIQRGRAAIVEFHEGELTGEEAP